MHISISKRTEPFPPLQINSYSVRGVCEHLFPVFDYFRHTLINSTSLKRSDWSRFPGIYSESLEKLYAYQLFLDFYTLRGKQAELENRLFPRGSLDAEVMICDIAPGHTDIAYYEAAWMFGPSSKILHQAVASREIYYTNICKRAFDNNQYDVHIARSWIDSFLRELRIINPKLVIFLGNYSVYSEVKELCNSHLQIHHPAYALRTGTGTNWAMQLDEQLKDFPKFPEVTLPKVKDFGVIHNVLSYANEEKMERLVNKLPEVVMLPIAKGIKNQQI